MRRRTVRLRITSIAVAIVGAALLVAAAFLLVLVDRALTANVDRQARLRVSEVTELVRDGELPATLAGEDDGTVAQVMSDDGRVLSQSPSIHGYSPLTPVAPPSEEITIRTVVGAGVGDGEDTYRVAAARVDLPDGPVAVYAAASLEPVLDTMQVLRILLGVMVPLLILVVGVTTWRLVGRTLEPVEAIRRQVAEISATRLDRRVPEPDTADEVQRLARTMNAMLDRLDAAARHQRTFVSDASHELRSPLAAIRTKLEVALTGRGSPDWPRVAREWLAEQARLERLVADLLVLARLDEGAPGPSSVVDLDELVLTEARDLQTRGRVRVDVTGVDGGRVRGNPVQLRRVVANLLENAERHAASAVRCGLSTSDHTVELTVADDGPGIPPGDRRRVFDRFVRLDEARDQHTGGAGLGLAIVHEVVTAHGGTVEVRDAAPGACFVVHLAAARDPR